MKNLGKIPLVFIICLFLESSLLAQNDKSDSGSEVPKGSISVLVVPDPNCPIQITGPFRIFAYPNGGFYFGYTLQNSSKADVESFIIQEWDWFGGNGYDVSHDIRDGEHLESGISHYSLPDEVMNDVIPFDKNERVQSVVSRQRNKIWVVMVEKVKLADVTVYDATKKYQQLEKFFSDMDRSSVAQPDKLKQWEHDLRQFVTNLMIDEK